MSAALTARLAQPYPGPSLPSPSHIRLVYLHPGTDEAVYCELITSINMTTQGSETTQQFSVTSNCYSALKRLRYRDRTRVLWIDALAIDQSNVDERNYQVSLMSRIYSQAASVVVYLGESGDNSDLAIVFIMECDDPSQGTTSLSFPKSDILMGALRNFFLRPWFTRVWVIQENYYLVNTRLRFRLPYVVSASNRHFEEETTEELLLRDLLDSRHCEATDPRDKVYSLLPILQSFNKSLGLIPRYQDTPEKIYTDCALSLLPSCGWKILYAVQGQSTTWRLPSWVPDWNVLPQQYIIGTAPWLEMSSFWTDKVLPGVPRKPQIILRSSDKGQIPVLHGHGYSCGKILKLGSTYIAGQTPFPAKEWYNLVNKIDLSTRVDKSGSGSPDPKFPHRTESFVKFLRLARYLYSSSMKEEEEDPADDLPRPDFVIGGARSSYEGYKFGSKWEDTIRKLATERKDGVLPFRDIPFHYAAAGWPPSYGNTIRGNLEACHLRRCFVTDTGYFGLAPAEAENGDRVFLCVGASVPFVLRETQSTGGDEFDLVGESYLQAGAWFEMVNNDSQPQALYII
ncbi:heterokaryon incompatibility protein-domain-containing protein [Fusarium oxysporum]|nr:heterokaryon incompatibility protein-domain-containing protein [Fusarium oxysporum]